jgi:hypothetical protein
MSYLQVLLLLGAVPQAVVGNTVRTKVTVSPRSGENVKDLDKTADTYVGYLSPDSQFPTHLGQLGLGPYTVALLGHNPLLTALLLRSLLSNPALGVGYGAVPPASHFHARQLYGRDPLVPLLLRQYGKYLPYGLGRYGLYGYSAPNNAEDNKPFGSFKYEYRL